MSIIGLALNLLLAVLLAAALVMGWRLNRRLKALRDSHDGFALAVKELNAAAERAEQGLADLRAATDEATDNLSDRIEKGRALAVKLERLIQHQPVASQPVARSGPRDEDAITERNLGALLAAAREARSRIEREDPLDLRDPVMSRQRPAPEDDLFADPPLRRPLSAITGGRR